MARVRDLSQTMEVKVTAIPKAAHCEITVVATNKDTRPVVLKFNTAQQYDFYAKDQNQRIVWKWSNDRVFANVQTKTQLQPGQALSHSVKWKYLRNDGYRAKAGKYQIMGAVTAQPQNIYSKPVTLEVPEAAPAG